MTCLLSMSCNRVDCAFVFSLQMSLPLNPQSMFRCFSRNRLAKLLNGVPKRVILHSFHVSFLADHSLSLVLSEEQAKRQRMVQEGTQWSYSYDAPPSDQIASNGLSGAEVEQQAANDEDTGPFVPSFPVPPDIEMVR